MVHFLRIAATMLVAVSASLAAPLPVEGHNEAPLNDTLSARAWAKTLAGRIEYFTRPDCTNPCDIGSNCGGNDKKFTGDLIADKDHTQFGRWNSQYDSRLCWDRPLNAVSVMLTTTGNGYDFSTLNCDEITQAVESNDWSKVTVVEKAVPLQWGGGAADGMSCNGPDRLVPGIRSVSYRW